MPKPRLPSKPPIGWYQIILLGDRDTCVLTTCPGLHLIAERPEFELATYWSQVRRPNHSATEPHISLSVIVFLELRLHVIISRSPKIFPTIGGFIFIFVSAAGIKFSVANPTWVVSSRWMKQLSREAEIPWRSAISIELPFITGGAHPLEVPRYQTMTRRMCGRIRRLQAPIKATEPTSSTFQHCPPAAVALWSWSPRKCNQLLPTIGLHVLLAVW